MYLFVLLLPARHAKENATILHDGILLLAAVTFIKAFHVSTLSVQNNVETVT